MTTFLIFMLGIQIGFVGGMMFVAMVEINRDDKKNREKRIAQFLNDKRGGFKL